MKICLAFRVGSEELSSHADVGCLLSANRLWFRFTSCRRQIVRLRRQWFQFCEKQYEILRRLCLDSWVSSLVVEQKIVTLHPLFQTYDHA